MKRRNLSILLLALLTVTLISTTITNSSAHAAPPCNDSDGDGSPSGHEYAKHHISSLAKLGNLGNDGHKPGSHQGFSVCNPSGDWLMPEK